MLRAVPRAELRKIAAGGCLLGTQRADRSGVEGRGNVTPSAPLSKLPPSRCKTTLAFREIGTSLRNQSVEAGGLLFSHCRAFCAEQAMGNLISFDLRIRLLCCTP